jgi:Tol biopolymer transport system component
VGRRGLLTSALIATAGLLIAAAPAAASYPGKPGAIAYSVQFGPPPLQNDLFTLRLGGTPQPLTETGDVSEYDPSYSGDGRRVAFTHNDAGTATIWAMNSNGGDAHPVTSMPGASAEPAISPDGRWIVFVHATGAESELWIVNANGGEPDRLTDNDLYEYGPAFSPDGRRIAFEVFGEGNGTHLSTMNANGTGIRPLTSLSDPGYDASASWAPDGRRLAFYRANFNDTLRQIWIVGANGAGARPVTRNQTGYFSHPIFSPNGSRIGFLEESTDRLLLVKPGGGAAVPVADDIGFDPEWVPVPVRCGGRRATMVGTGGPDRLLGTGRRDVITGLGGRDRIRGKGGRDVLCGGGGRDRRNGGRGRDRCIGGPRPDRAAACERTRSL